jgi:nucleoside permease NupC
MLKVHEIAAQLQLDVLSSANLFHPISGGYASDLLSCVMASAKAGNVWVTLQAHPNVVAVASLLDLAAVIITEGIVPDEETAHKAREEAVNVLTTRKDTYTVVSELAALGITSGRPG